MGQTDTDELIRRVISDYGVLRGQDGSSVGGGMVSYRAALLRATVSHISQDGRRRPLEEVACRVRRGP